MDDALATAVLAALRPLVAELVREAVAAARGPVWLTTEQAAERAGRSPKCIRAWVARGLPAVRHGRTYRILAADLDAWQARPSAVQAGAERLLRSL